MFTMLPLIILAAILTILILTYYWLKSLNANYWKNQNVVYVEKTNPLGVTLDYVLNDKSLSEMWKEVLDKYPDENQVGVFQGWRPTLLIRDPENIQAVMAGDFLSFHQRGIYMHPEDKLADNVLFMEDYNRWKLMRKKVSPVFTSAKLKNMFYIMERTAKDFVKYVGETKDIEPNPFNIVYNYSTSSIAATVFGIDPDLENTMNSPFVKMASTAFVPTTLTKINFGIIELFPRAMTLLNLKLLGAHEKFFIGVVKNVLRSREHEKIKRHDFIDLCIELQKNGTMIDPTSNCKIEPTDELLAAQAFFFFTAGADTTATTISFTLFELAKNPDILERLHKEIDEVFSRCGDTIPHEEILKLQYLEMVLKEAMRKYPPIGALQRKCARDTVLPNGRIIMKKGTLPIIPVFALHRDPKYYPNPDKFDPERFSPENIHKIVSHTYFPFGFGNRTCLGYRFALLQIKTGLTYLLRRYTLRTTATDQDVKIEASNFAIRDPNLKYEFVDRNLTA